MPLSAEISERAETNIERVRHLVTLYSSYAGPGSGRRNVSASDILRAAIVMLHATLEDFLRALAAERLPTANEAFLNRVPLVGTEGRAEKFFLGALAAHRQKTVADVIGESVREHLQKVNYNDTTEISVLLQAMGVPLDEVNSRFADIGAMIERRHHIVHQADRNPRQGEREHWAQSISLATVNRWIDAVEEFIADVDAELE